MTAQAAVRSRLRLRGAAQQISGALILAGVAAWLIWNLITAPGHKTLITQAYFATDPFFEGNPDKNFKKRNIVSNRDLIRPVSLFEAPGTPRASIEFDICLETL